MRRCINMILCSPLPRINNSCPTARRILEATSEDSLCRRCVLHLQSVDDPSKQVVVELPCKCRTCPKCNLHWAASWLAPDLENFAAHEDALHSWEGPEDALQAARDRGRRAGHAMRCVHRADGTALLIATGAFRGAQPRSLEWCVETYARALLAVAERRNPVCGSREWNKPPPEVSPRYRVRAAGVGVSADAVVEELVGYGARLVMDDEVPFCRLRAVEFTGRTPAVIEAATRAASSLFCSESRNYRPPYRRNRILEDGVLEEGIQEQRELAARAGHQRRAA